MSIKTWQERQNEVPLLTTHAAMFEEIGELRAALAERDETINDLRALLRTHQHFLQEAHDELNGKGAK